MAPSADHTIASPVRAPTPSGMIRFLDRHRILAYCAATFGIAWGGIYLLIGPAAIPVDAERLALLIGLGYVAMLAGPPMAGVVLTGLIDGRAGLRELLARLLRRRVGGRWYAAALLTAPLSFAGVLFALALVWPQFLPRIVVEENWVGLLQFSLVTALLTGVFEEVGWTGFALPALRRRHSVFRAGLLLGLLYAAWNALIVYLVESIVRTPGSLPLFVYVPATLFSWQVAYRVLLVWLYERTASLLVVVLMATSLVASWTCLTPTSLTQGSVVALYLALAAIWFAGGAVILRRAPGSNYAQDMVVLASALGRRASMRPRRPRGAQTAQQANQ